MRRSGSRGHLRRHRSSHQERASAGGRRSGRLLGTDVDERPAVVLETGVLRATSATKSSIRFASSARELAERRGTLSTCRSGSTRRCVSACGLMSADRDEAVGAFATWSPRRLRACRRDNFVKWQRYRIPSSVTALPRTRHELADRRRRRATACSRRRSRGRAGRRARRRRVPTFPRQRRAAGVVGQRPQAARSARFFTSRRHGVLAAGPCRAAASTGRRAPSVSRRPPQRRACCSKARLVLGREADDHVGASG